MDSSPLIAGLELLFRRYNITTVDELAMLLRQDGNGVADYITSSENRQAVYKRWSSWQQSQPSANNASTAQASVQATTVGTAIGIQLNSWTAGAWQHRPPTSWTWWTWTLLSVYWQRLYPPPQSLRCRVRALLPTCSIQMRAMILWNGVCPILWCRSLLLCFGAQTGAGRQRMRVSLRRDSADLYWSGRPRSCPDRKWALGCGGTSTDPKRAAAGWLTSCGGKKVGRDLHQA